jgi:hypothetical protein
MLRRVGGRRLDLLRLHSSLFSCSVPAGSLNGSKFAELIFSQESLRLGQHLVGHCSEE